MPKQRLISKSKRSLTYKKKSYKLKTQTVIQVPPPALPAIAALKQNKQNNSQHKNTFFFHLCMTQSIESDQKGLTGSIFASPLTLAIEVDDGFANLGTQNRKT